MTILRLVLSLVGLTFGVVIVWAIMNGNFGEAGRWLVSDPWGIVTLADLYFGFLLSAVIIALFERPLHALLWIAPIPFLGNVWTVVWFVWRLPLIAKAARLVSSPRG